MTTRRLILLCLFLCLGARAAFGGEVRVYGRGERPDPRDVAAILQRDAAGPGKIRWRSIRPVDPAETPAGALSLPVQFAFDSARILPEATTQLDAVAEGIALAGPQARVVIEGHTDAAGPDGYNEALSRLRAEAVKTYLVERHGIAATRLRVIGYGERRPLDTVDPFGRENRRVQFRADGGLG